MTYWRAIILALLCQLLAVYLPDALSSSTLIVWFLTILAPLMIITLGLWIDQGLSLLSKVGLTALAAISIGFLCFDQFKSDLTKQAVSSHPLVETKIYAPESNQGGWETLESPEGGFSVMSPLPATTHISYRTVNGTQLKITSTRIKDTFASFIVLTTHYPKGFPLPDPSSQANLAMNHLMQKYKYDKILDVKAVVQKGYNALAFVAVNSSTQEQVTGLIIPTGPVLYQTLVLSTHSQPAEEETARFLTSFDPKPYLENSNSSNQEETLLPELKSYQDDKSENNLERSQ